MKTRFGEYVTRDTRTKPGNDPVMLLLHRVDGLREEGYSPAWIRPILKGAELLAEKSTRVGELEGAIEDARLYLARGEVGDAIDILANVQMCHGAKTDDQS